MINNNLNPEISDRVPNSTTTSTINNRNDVTETVNTNNTNVAVANEATATSTTSTKIDTETKHAIANTGLNASIQALIPNVEEQMQKHTQHLQQLQQQHQVNAICNQIAQQQQHQQQQQQQQTQLLQNIETIPDHLLKSIKEDDNNDCTIENNTTVVVDATTINTDAIAPDTAAQQQPMPFEQTLTNATTSTVASTSVLKTGAMGEAFMTSLPLQIDAQTQINSTLNDNNSAIKQFEAITGAKAAMANPTGGDKSKGGGNAWCKAATSYGENRWTKNGFGETSTTVGGKFSPLESELVQHAIKEYCASKNITPAKLCFESDHRSPDLKGAWMEIAKKLPHRTVQSVYRHGLRQLHPFKRGAWSEDECKKLNELVMSNGKKWSLIQKEVHRSADSCRDKYREMSFVKGRWTDGELKVLVNIVREEIRCPAPLPTPPEESSSTTPNIQNILQIQDLIEFVENNNISIPWSNISKKINTRSRLSCFKKWQKIVKQHKDGGTFVGGQAPKVIVEDKRLQFSQLPPPSNINSTATDTVPIIQFPPLQQQQLIQQQLQQQSLSQKQQANDDIGGLIRSGFLVPSSNTINYTNLQPTQQNPMINANTITSSMTKDGETLEQYDKNLLVILSSSNTHIYPTDIQWNTIPRPSQAQNPQTRWIELMGSENYNMQQLPIFQLSKFILEKKIRKEKEAEAAAASVVLETMQLPSTKDLLDRIHKVTNAVNDVGNNNSDGNVTNMDSNSIENNMNKKRKVEDISNTSIDI